MIAIKQKDKRMVVEIRDEAWQFEDYSDFEKCLSAILGFKKKHGQGLNKEYND